MIRFRNLPLSALASVMACTVFMAPAHARSTNEMVSMCVDAADAREIASSDEYWAKMKKIRGGSVKTLKIEMISKEEGEKITIQCKVRRGEVVELSVQ